MTGRPPGVSAEDESKFLAAVELVRRTGASGFQLRWSDDEQPMLWMAVAVYAAGDVYEDGGAEVDASLSPFRAVLRLCERLIDGGRCAHCGRPSGFDPDSFETMPLNKMVCWYQWDPELSTFRRGCE